MINDFGLVILFVRGFFMKNENMCIFFISNIKSIIVCFELIK